MKLYLPIPGAGLRGGARFHVADKLDLRNASMAADS